MKTETITEIICILDKSGSMEILQSETIAGLNQFIEEQKREPGLCNFSLVQFNQGLETTVLRQAIQQVGKLTRKSYQPNGYTALLDAVGQTLKTAMETHFMLPANLAPDKVLVFIITDGQENASSRYSRSQISTMINQLQTNKGWEFQFFGANIDAFSEAQGIGISQDQADNWDYNKAGLNVMMKKMGDRAKEVRAK